MKINENFIKWACSMSGCDGGNPKASTWLCGIEWGGGNDEYYRQKLKQEISVGEVILDPDKTWVPNTKDYPYDRNFMKLWSVIQGHKLSDYNKLPGEMSGKEIFKMNLYPINFQSTKDSLWHKHGLDELTGFKDKFLFNTWCFFNRFPYFTKLRERHKPKLIICLGVSYFRDYLKFFFGDREITDIHVGHIQPESESNKGIRSYYWTIVDGSTLVVIPFFSGSNGLNSHFLIKEMGEKIRELL